MQTKWDQTSVQSARAIGFELIDTFFKKKDDEEEEEKEDEEEYDADAESSSEICRVPSSQSSKLTTVRVCERGENKLVDNKKRVDQDDDDWSSRSVSRNFDNDAQPPSYYSASVTPTPIRAANTSSRQARVFVYYYKSDL